MVKTDSSQIDTLLYELDEVVITGTRYEKKIIDIPYPVARVVESEFKFEKRIAVDDVLSTIPGLFLQSRYGNHDVRISIRGFGSRSNSGIRGVRILLDEIPESEPDGQTRIEAIDFNAIGKIEVVKGNASSLFPNSPGGVVNFINDIYFLRPMAVQFNEIASFGLRRHGIKTGYRSENYTFLFTYSNHRYEGYRDHNKENWRIINTVLETRPTKNTTLQILGYYVDGQIKLPGSLTRQEFNDNPWQAAQREIDFDFRRYSKKGRLGIRFIAYLDNDKKNEFEITGYGTIKYFERTSRIFRIINRDGLGLTLRYVRKNKFFNRENEFSIGGDWQYQTGPIEFYDNINGQKGDILEQLINKTNGNRGFFFQNSTDFYRQRLYLMFTGRYDWVEFDWKNQLLAVQNARKSFKGFTPKIAMNYKLKPYLSIYTSYVWSFRSPAGNELDNPPFPIGTRPGELLNPDLKSQKSKNFELGMKGMASRPDAWLFPKVIFEAALFRYDIEQEIVPFEINGEFFFQNSARTIRNGLELGFGINIFHPLRMNIAYTLSDFIYDRYTASRFYYDNQFNLVLEQRDFSNNIVPSVPRHNFSLSLKYEESIYQWLTGYSQFSYWGVSGMYTDDANSEKTKEYGIFHVTLGMDASYGPLNLILAGGVRNLFNDTYVGFININSATGQFYEAGSPRNYFTSLKIGLQF
jgi:iron complex outermembrane receptor protein